MENSIFIIIIIELLIIFKIAILGARNAQKLLIMILVCYVVCVNLRAIGKVPLLVNVMLGLMKMLLIFVVVRNIVFNIKYLYF